MNAMYAASIPIGQITARNNAVPGVILGFSIPSFLVANLLHRTKNDRSAKMQYENTASCRFENISFSFYLIFCRYSRDLDL